MTVVCEGSGGLMTEAWRAVVLRFKSDDFDSGLLGSALFTQECKLVPEFKEA